MGSDCDTPSRWLVHYIAENIEKSETSESEEEKQNAQIKCVDAILKLWKQRSNLPRGMLPFDDFDSVFRGLSRLDNSSNKPYYNELNQFNQTIADDESNECKNWINIAIFVDKVAKELVSNSFELAANEALSEETKVILSNVPDASDNDIRIMLDFMYEEDSVSSNSKEIEKLKSKIENIEKLKTICDGFLEGLNKELTAHQSEQVEDN